MKIKGKLKEMFKDVILLVDPMVEQGRAEDIPEQILNLLFSPKYLWVVLVIVKETKELIEDDLRKGNLVLNEEDRERWVAFIQEWGSINQRRIRRN
jgi:hypothetical protein